jgi:hypothetical protein
MAIIQSGATADLLTIDPTSKAVRSTLYDAAGNPMSQAAAAWSAHFPVRQSATTGAGAHVAYIRNTHATKKVYIERILVDSAFDGTGAATLMAYKVQKGVSVSGTSGGTAVTALNKTTSVGNPVAAADIAFIDTGATLTGLSAGGILGSFYAPRPTLSAGSATAATNPLNPPVVWDFTGPLAHPIQLVQNEVIYFDNLNTAVIGDRLNITIDFLEV